MHFLYLDDSGSVDNLKQTHFVLGGVVIPVDKLYHVNKRLDDLASQFLPSDPFGVEFHASDIFTGRISPWDTLKHKEQRITAIQGVLNVINSEGLATIACAIEKSTLPKEEVVERAFEIVITKFQGLLTDIHHKRRSAMQSKRNKKDIRSHGTIIFDKFSYEKQIQKLALNFRRDGTKYRNIQSIYEVPLFVDSAASRGTQLADHVAYSVFRRYNGNDLTYFNVIQNSFKEHYLYHYNQSIWECTCPSCLRRRLAKNS